MIKPIDVWNYIFPPKLGDKVELAWKRNDRTCIARGELISLPRKEFPKYGTLIPNYIIYGSFEEHYNNRSRIQGRIMIEVRDEDVKIKILKRQNTK